jgi:hypothetical protein
MPVVLVPITTVQGRAIAARRIHEAKSALREQRYEHAVILARQALGAVREICDTQNANARALAKSPGDRDQGERWAVLIQSTYSLFSADDETLGTAKSFTWARADAVAAVVAAAGLLARLEDLP